MVKIMIFVVLEFESKNTDMYIQPIGGIKSKSSDVAKANWIRLTNVFKHKSDLSLKRGFSFIFTLKIIIIRGLEDDW